MAQEIENPFLQACTKKTDPHQLSSLALAYIGDGVFELLVRTFVVSRGSCPVNQMHKNSREIVNANSQAEFYFQIADLLTEEEHKIFLRGRNAKSYTSPKHASVSDYRHATGLEAVFGYLYLTGQMERALELFQAGLQKKNE